MAKKNSKTKTKTTKSVANDQVANDQVANDTQSTSIPQEAKTMAETLTFTLGSTNKAGQGRYHFAGYSATLFFSKSCFDGTPPNEITILADGVNFATPGAKAPKAPKVAKVLSPEEQAKKDARAAKRAALAGNREAQAEKLRAKLAKLEARIAGKPTKGAKVIETPVEEPVEEL